ncbi:hypothetical protein [Staphylococcus hyicus]|uniref:hypothetical protein n=1 Tax=Staphylococcus hyicus TaxID=1284 RepID=UPI00208F56D8|nr:hypothetical protein [Staphylococcus hyicus]MCO4330668.1 hypothetical protein [Staphylococcus hyicus]MCO4333066.1 hypothetical protein [Staphylococcus hyicus]
MHKIPYFNETHKFINKIKKNHEIEAFTGHAKGGRDAMVLGIEHSITMPNTSLEELYFCESLEYIYVKSMN